MNVSQLSICLNYGYRLEAPSGLAQKVQLLGKVRAGSTDEQMPFERQTLSQGQRRILRFEHEVRCVLTGSANE